MKDPADPALDAIDVFLDPAFISGNRTSLPGISDIRAATIVYRLFYAAALLTTVGAKPAEVGWLDPGEGGLNVFDFNMIPAAAGTPGIVARFKSWRRLVALFQVRDRARSMSALITRYAVALAGPGAKANACKEIAAGLALVADDTDAAAIARKGRAVEEAAVMLGMLTLADYRDPTKFKRLLDYLLAAKKLGAGLHQVELLAGRLAPGR